MKKGKCYRSKEARTKINVCFSQFLFFYLSGTGKYSRSNFWSYGSAGARGDVDKLWNDSTVSQHLRAITQTSFRPAATFVYILTNSVGALFDKNKDSQGGGDFCSLLSRQIYDCFSAADRGHNDTFIKQPCYDSEIGRELCVRVCSGGFLVPKNILMAFHVTHQYRRHQHLLPSRFDKSLLKPLWKPPLREHNLSPSSPRRDAPSPPLSCLFNTGCVIGSLSVPR